MPGRPHRLRFVRGLLSIVALAIPLLSGCADPRPEQEPRWLVVGVDGAEWNVIEALWSRGELPHLRALAAAGSAGRLGTDYGSSPVIWTTVATGTVPEVHGITDFAVPTERGDVPVSSTVRKVPALWNMLSTAGRRVAVVSWWVSWPAEPVHGVVLSDRWKHGLEDAVFPPDLTATVAEWSEAAGADGLLFDARLASAERDDLTLEATLRLLELDFELVLSYLRSVDIASHRFWKYWEPEAFPGAEFRDDERELVPDAYRALDIAIGRLVAAAGPDTNVVVLSDHGFHAMRSERVRLFLNFDQVLVRLGLQQRGPDGIRWEKTSLFVHETPHFRTRKKLRFGPQVEPAERERIRRRLAAGLATISYAGGEPVFKEPAEPSAGEDADLVVEVFTNGATRDLLYGDRRWDDFLPPIERLSGSHSDHTAGVFFAAGPDVETGVTLEGFDIHDITPTLLHALRLPVAEDFAGEPFLSLFTSELRNRPVRRVESWGTLEGSSTTASEADEAILDDLRALGYLD